MPEAAAGSSAAIEEEEEEEIEYVFVSLEGVSNAVPSGEIAIDGILSDAPTVTVGGRSFTARFDEDLGSTLYFDRGSLKRAADAEDQEAAELELDGSASRETPLVCVTSKRLRIIES